MIDPITGGPPTDIDESLSLGKALGQADAFALLAGRCSAAQAEALLRIREEKLWLRFAPSWRRFCPHYFNMSSSQIDRIIRLWQQFGPAFFELRQLVRVSPEFYRTIEPAIKEGALHYNDEAIELDPANAQKVATAVTELRRAAPPKPKPTLEERLADLDKRCAGIASDFKDIAGVIFGPDRERFAAVLERASAALHSIEIEQGIR